MLTGSRKAPGTAGGSAANLDPGIKSRSHSFCFAPRSHTQYHSIKVHKHRREHSPPPHTLAPHATGPSSSASTGNAPESTVPTDPGHRVFHSCSMHPFTAKKTHPHSPRSRSTTCNSPEYIGIDKHELYRIGESSVRVYVQPYFLNADRLSLCLRSWSLAFHFCNRHHARAPGCYLEVRRRELLCQTPLLSLR